MYGVHEKHRNFLAHIILDGLTHVLPTDCVTRLKANKQLKMLMDSVRLDIQIGQFIERHTTPCKQQLEKGREQNFN